MGSLAKWSFQVIKFLVFTEAYYLARTYFLSREPEITTIKSKLKRKSVKVEQVPKDENANVRPKIDVNASLFFPDQTIVVPPVMSHHERKSKGVYSIQDDPAMWWNIPNFFERNSQGPLKELIKLLRTTETTIDICMFVVSFPTLADVLIELRKRSIDVRLIVDGREKEAFKSQISYLKASGIKVRCNQHSYSCLMHNKFLVIDDYMVLSGSFNWTKAAVLFNYDNILITTQANLVRDYSEQFNVLWSSFIPYQEHTSF
ncbi:Mitochondrial cardiolipin hydrolase [Halotydeus destructor]|nr:Mitochondrial cardiolipin hydrolase [Halotydeus destructor]